MNLDDWLDKLLEKCAKSMTPDYSTFYSEVDEKLATGVSPRDFCEVFAAKVKEYDGLMRIYDKRGRQEHKPSSAELAEFKSTFQKYKLLNGCAEKLPTEIRQQIANLAGCPVMGT